MLVGGIGISAVKNRSPSPEKWRACNASLTESSETLCCFQHQGDQHKQRRSFELNRAALSTDAKLKNCASSEDFKLDMDAMFPIFHAEPNNIVIEGFLEKRGVWNPSWRSRYFVLESRGRLSYFKNEDDSACADRALGTIPISKHTTIVPVPAQAAGAASRKRAVFEVRMPDGEVSSGRAFLLSAPTRELGERWSAALAEVRRRVLYVSFPPNVRHW
jgi:hypothetical protein